MKQWKKSEYWEKPENLNKDKKAFNLMQNHPLTESMGYIKFEGM